MKAVAALKHFLLGLFLCPALKNHPVHGHDQARPVRTVPTVHQDGLGRAVDDAQCADDILIMGVPGVHGYISEQQVPAFVQGGIPVGGAQGQDGFDAQVFRAAQALSLGLAGAIDFGIHPVKIGEPFPPHGLGPSAVPLSGLGTGIRRVCGVQRVSSDRRQQQRQ